MSIASNDEFYPCVAFNSSLGNQSGIKYLAASTLD
jgi:hypothetical protein